MPLAILLYVPKTSREFQSNCTSEWRLTVHGQATTPPQIRPLLQYLTFSLSLFYCYNVARASREFHCNSTVSDWLTVHVTALGQVDHSPACTLAKIPAAISHILLSFPPSLPPPSLPPPYLPPSSSLSLSLLAASGTSSTDGSRRCTMPWRPLASVGRSSWSDTSSVKGRPQCPHRLNIPEGRPPSHPPAELLPFLRGRWPQSVGVAQTARLIRRAANRHAPPPPFPRRGSDRRASQWMPHLQRCS